MDPSQITLAFLNTLAPLTLLSPERWVGQQVYHPGAGQLGDLPYWRFCDEEPWMRKVRFDPDDGDDPADEPDWEALIYDRGEVQRVTEGPWGPEHERSVFFRPDVCAGNKCNCDCSPDFCLQYTETNLWIDLPYSKRTDLEGVGANLDYLAWWGEQSTPVRVNMAANHRARLTKAWPDCFAGTFTNGCRWWIWRRPTGAFVCASGAGTVIEVPRTMSAARRILAAQDLMATLGLSDEAASC